MGVGDAVGVVVGVGEAVGVGLGEALGDALGDGDGLLFSLVKWSVVPSQRAGMLFLEYQPHARLGHIPSS